MATRAPDLPSPFPPLGLQLTEGELRETAYEIFAAACKPSLAYGRTRSGLTYTPQPSQRPPASPPAAGKMRKALGLSSRAAGGPERLLLDPAAAKAGKPRSAGEVVRSRMGVGERGDARIRRALARTAAGQIGKDVKLILLPLELLQQIRSVDFADPHEYQSWQRRQLKVLEAGLLLHPAVKLEQSNNAAQRLRQLIDSSAEKPLETGKNSETMQALRSAAVSLASRIGGEKTAEVCHWVDGFPFNLHLYQMLLNAFFDKTEETVVIDEIDEVTELIKKTWGILGIHQSLHNVCFMWTLFCRFVVTGKSELDLLRATESHLAEVANDAKESKDFQYTIVLSSILSTMQSWGEKRFLAYHDTFPAGAKGMMECLLPVTLNAAKILSDDLSKENKYRKKEADAISNRIDFYVRSSIRTAFAQLMEQVDSKRRLLKGEKGAPPALVVLAKDTMGLIASETEKFSPTLKCWHSFAAGLAAATLHSCFRKELDQFLQGVKVLTSDAVEVLLSADELEKVLVQVAVEDAVDCEDGGKGLINEMTPFEADSTISTLSKNWIKETLDRLKHWVDRNVKQEEWDPRANREHYAPSIVEVFRMIEETLDAFYTLPIMGHSEFLQELVAGIDKAMRYYALQSKIGCGSKKDFLPSFPSLTRCRVTKNNSNFGSFWKKKERGLTSHRSKTQQEHINSTWREKIESSDLPHICVRINTLYHIQTELDSLEMRISNGWKKDTPSNSMERTGLEKYLLKTFSNVSEWNGPKVVVGQASIRFEHARSGAQEGIQQLCEGVAYKIVFHDLQTLFGNGLYSGGVTQARIIQIHEPLDIQLEIIAKTVHEQLRNRVISCMMKACFEGFLMVLLAGGPSRFFTVNDAEMLDEDFTALKDLFKANGEGLPGEVVEKAAMPVNQVLPLFSVDTTDLIETFKSTLMESYGAIMAGSNKVLPLPDTTGQWKPTDANTILRILCYRCDKAASRFLKKMYNLPKS